MKRTVKIVILMFALTMAFGMSLAHAAAEAAEIPTRTVMMYCDGSDLEAYSYCATDNLIQAMESEYNENLNYIVITGGSKRWHMEEEYLSGAESISTEVCQVWKLEGKQDGEDHGKMILCAPNGIVDDPDTLMSDPAMLQAFIDYCYEEYPADIYDLIMWGHGAGPVGGFSMDMRDSSEFLSLLETAQAFDQTKMVRDGKRFETINYDACMMGSVEIVAALADYADFFICSAEEVPGGGQDYSALMNALKDSISVGGFELGKQLVDKYIETYMHSALSDAEISTMSVISSDNFKTRLLPLLNTLSETLLSEAKNRGDINGLYNFYDELYSEYAAYENGTDDSYDLFDLGNLMSALSCWQVEADNLTVDAIGSYRNPYTDLAIEIMTVLADDDNSGDDVIYSDSASDMKLIVRDHNLRAADGSMTAYNDGKPCDVFPTGLSIFYPSAEIYQAYEYLEAMNELADALPEGDVRTFFERHVLAVTYYGLINSLGSKVAEMTLASDTAPSYGDLRSELQSDEMWEDYHESMMSYLVARGEFASLDEAEAFFADIVTQLSGEAVAEAKIDVRQLRNDEGYIARISETSAHWLVGAGSCMRVEVAPDDLNFKMYMTQVGYSYYDRKRFFPDGFVFDMNKENFKMETDGFVEDASDSDQLIIQRAYGASDVNFMLQQPSDICLVLYDADMNPHIADAIFIDEEHTEAYIPIITFEQYLHIKNYYLCVCKSGGKWQVEGILNKITGTGERDYIPMDSDVFTTETWIYYTTVTKMTDAYYEETNFMPISSFSEIDAGIENWGITVGEAHVGDLVLFSDRCYYLKDIFDNEIDITDLVTQAELIEDEEPAPEEPGEEPGEEPDPEEPGEEPAPEEPIPEEPGEEPAAEEPVNEEPSAEEPAAEEPANEQTPVPKTGDDSRMEIWMMLIIVSGCGMAAMIALRKRVF